MSAPTTGIGHEEVVEAGVREDLGLRRLGHGQPGGAGRELQARDLDDLVGLGVRPQAHPGGARPLRHGGDVALDAVEVDEDGGGGDVVHAGHSRRVRRKPQREASTGEARVTPVGGPLLR